MDPLFNKDYSGNLPYRLHIKDEHLKCAGFYFPGVEIDLWYGGWPQQITRSTMTHEAAHLF